MIVAVTAATRGVVRRLERLKPGRDTVEPVVMPFSDADPAVSR
jgi:hypothetical protein